MSAFWNGSGREGWWEAAADRPRDGEAETRPTQQDQQALRSGQRKTEERLRERREENRLKAPRLTWREPLTLTQEPAQRARLSVAAGSRCAVTSVETPQQSLARATEAGAGAL